MLNWLRILSFLLIVAPLYPELERQRTRVQDQSIEKGLRCKFQSFASLRTNLDLIAQITKE